jgi:uncharacterized membrane protein YdfJ with MMPL/SSD domain
MNSLEGEKRSRSSMTRFLYWLGMFAARRKWVVIGAWALAAVALVISFRASGSNTSDNLELHGLQEQVRNREVSAGDREAAARLARD